MSELKPCPFCGKTARLDYSVKPNGKHWFITCDRCGMMYQDVISQRKYVKDGWNTRPIEDALKARIAELEEAMRLIPVSEKLPEGPDIWKNYLVFDDRTRSWDVASFYDKRWNVNSEMWDSDDVTHWMPLLEQPEEQKCGGVDWSKVPEVMHPDELKLFKKTFND